MNILLGLPTMTVCLLLQAVLLVKVLRYYSLREEKLHSHSFWSTLRVISGVMLLLVMGNLAQVAIWGELFLLLGEFTSFSEAFYHSAVNFATLGYGDMVMLPEHRLLGPLEAINGVLMIGVSTAALMAAFQDVIRKNAQTRRIQG